MSPAATDLVVTGLAAPLRRGSFLCSRLPWRSPRGPACGGWALLLQRWSEKVPATIAPLYVPAEIPREMATKSTTLLC